MPTLTSMTILFVVALSSSFAYGNECDDGYLLKESANSIIPLGGINGILKAHNEARRKVFPYAKVMPMLKWSDDIAVNAQKYVDKCIRDHSPEAERTDKAGFGYLGENMAQGSGGTISDVAIGGEHVTKGWNREETSWNYPKCEDGKVCGHYTQNIWAATTHVGCGFKSCGKNKGFWICQYGTGGNIGGGKPYVSTDSIDDAAQCTMAKHTSAASAPSGLCSVMIGILAMALTLVCVF